MKYAAYGVEDIKRQLDITHKVINENRREIRRHERKAKELTKAVEANNQMKKSLKRELKERLNNVSKGN